MWSRLLVLCLVAVLAQGCASNAAKPDSTEAALLVVEGIVISNELPFPVTDVMINIPASGRFAGCGNIMAASECRTSFTSVDYRAEAMVVNWKEYGKSHATGSFIVEAPEAMDQEKPVWLRVVIFAMGQAAAEFVQF